MDRQEARVQGTAARAAGPSLSTAAAVLALQTPGALASEAVSETIETHHSWVFLTPSFAYKLKKPSCTTRFDYTTVEARRRACEMELQLNRRLAPDTYLAVVPVTCEGGKVRVAGTGQVIDWLVKMRRLPREAMLDALIERRAVNARQIELLSQLLGTFYRRAPRAGFGAAEYRQRLAAEIESKRCSLAQPRYGLNAALIHQVSHLLIGWLERHSELIETRAPLVVEAHGDLRPEHICLQSEPIVIDCLDFDRELRLLDPVSELAFLALECRRLGCAWIGAQLLAAHAQRSGDGAPAALATFYQRYHGLLRAAVAIWHLDEAGQSVPAWRARAQQYLELAVHAP